MKARTTSNGSKVDDWSTPDYILEWVRDTYGDFFDPCPLHADFDGLKRSWDKVNFINPPYSLPLKQQFIIKAQEESMKGKICICLIPASTDTLLFHKVIVPFAKVLFIKGRVKFKGTNTKGEYVTNACGQSGSMLCIFGDTPGFDTIDFNKVKQ